MSRSASKTIFVWRFTCMCLRLREKTSRKGQRKRKDGVKCVFFPPIFSGAITSPNTHTQFISSACSITSSYARRAPFKGIHRLGFTHAAGSWAVFTIKRMWIIVQYEIISLHFMRTWGSGRGVSGRQTHAPQNTCWRTHSWHIKRI